MDRGYIYFIQILFVVFISIGSQSLNMNNKETWAFSIARYVMYILTMHVAEIISVLVYTVLQHKRDLNTRFSSKVNVSQVMIYIASVAVLLYNNQKLYNEDFLLICVAYLIVKYPVLIALGKATVPMGVGLATSYVEGYLVYIIPPAGEGQKTFEEKLRLFESEHNVVIPAKKFFIIVTKSMQSPSDLKDFNDKSGKTDVSRLELCSSLEEVVKDVAGVKNRIYKSSVYKLSGRGEQAVALCAVAECASPLYTLYKAVQNKHIYDHLIDVNMEEVVADFMSTLRSVLGKHPELANTCELLYFDDTDKNLNLADVLLCRIRELEPNFERIVNPK